MVKPSVAIVASALFISSSSLYAKAPQFFTAQQLREELATKKLGAVTGYLIGVVFGMKHASNVSVSLKNGPLMCLREATMLTPREVANKIASSRLKGDVELHPLVIHEFIINILADRHEC